MVNDDQTSGTPKSEGGDGQEAATAGTRTEDGRNTERVEGSGITREEALSWKAKAEEANRLREENEQLKSALQPPVVRSAESEFDPVQAVNRSRQFMAQDDPVAGLGVYNTQQLAALKADIDVLRLPEAERDKVVEHIKRNPGKFVDVNHARENLRHGALDEENRALRQRIAALEKEPPPGVRTDTVEVTASQHKAREMTFAQFDAEVARLMAEGDVAGANKLGLDLRAGKIKAS